MGKNTHFSSFLFFFLFLPCFHVQAQTSTYSVPDHYFINCGSTGITTVNRRNFVGDVNPKSFTLSAPHSTVAINPSTNSSGTLYGTARIFRHPSWYEFKNITPNSTYLVRFHFSAFNSQDGVDLHTARFSVSASNFNLLSDFQLRNSTNNASINSPLIKEFLMNLNADKFQIRFTPSGSSSLAFISAIEAFLAPDGLIKNSSRSVVLMGSSNSVYDGLISNALQVIHRINVGGHLVTPDNDTVLRTWVPDDDYMYVRNAAVKAPFRNAGPQYELGSVTRFDAPDPVYNSAKVLNVNGSVLQNINATWCFVVNRNSRFLVRAHFCDVLGVGVSSNILKFNLFIQNFVQLIDPHGLFTDTAVPFYIDFVVNSDTSGLMNISIGPRPDSSDNKTAFLNGLEIMELISSSSGSISKTNLAVIVGSVVGGGVLMIVSAVLLWFYLMSRKANPVDSLDECGLLKMNRGTLSKRSTERNASGSPLMDLNLGLKVSLREVLYATRNFDEELVIGKGGFGKVYRGILRDGTKVAVKRSEPGRIQGFSEFQTEIMVLSKIRHRHLVSLIGYCDDRSEMVLVYEFMENGTLKDHIYSSKGEAEKRTPESRLSWEKRLQLCIDAAKGLHYLHTGIGGAIIHRDVKSTNILLDEHFVAKVADFGISRLGELDQTHFSTEVKGSFGYFDPEYFTCLVLTEKSDVFSFGVVLLEVLCARQAVDNTLPDEQINLAEWGKCSLMKGELEKIIDPFLKGKISPDSLRRFGRIVQKCLQDRGADRPNMVDVLFQLEYALKLQQTALPWQPNESSNSEVSFNLPMPLIGKLPSFSAAISEYEMEDSDALLNGSNNHTGAIITMQEPR
ncbi:OLC1v1010234C1 [Oldenlandia corymbosa var. corymbosa]|uniref:OLC1v1010234C1 n=1 Tax=Oldenlandia corymbosa var. corymbosa TaxID=529605 RepID=A0AAV1DQW6_OLDCO|nr:OLC1v1010234C1 [Oldenlandia corymbosa var. corymbosa]